MAHPLYALVFVIVACAGLDHFMRRMRFYVGTDIEWPAMVRLRPRRVGDGHAYRAARSRALLQLVPAGIPAVVSVPLLLAVLVAVLWTCSIALGVGDLFDVLGGRRPLGATLASLGWCAMRAVAGWILVYTAWCRWPRPFALAAAVSALMDLALLAFPIPCSDHRADDVLVARVGGLVTLLCAVGFGIAHKRRHDAIPLDRYRTMH